MEDVFRSFWWLLFPLAWFILGGFQQLFRYRRQRDTIDLLKQYAASGREPPAELLASLNRPTNTDEYGWDDNSRCRGGGGGGIFSFVLFTGLAIGFGYAAWSGFYEAGKAFMIVSFVFGSLALACLATMLARRGRSAK